MQSGYFGGDAAGRKRYYGVKRQIAFQKKFPLSQYSYAPLARGSEMSLSTYGPSYKMASQAQRAARKEFMMSGRGRYYRGRGGYFGKLLGSMVGQADAGDKYGDMVWDFVKDKIPPKYSALGQAVFDITDDYKGSIKNRPMKGRGKYVTNSLIQDGHSSNIVPSFSTSDMQEITYSNKEYVRDIYAPLSGNVFEVQSWNLNPGLVSAFPWLSQIAINFEEYEFMQLIFTYKSTVADFASASGQVGQIAIATQYNPNAYDFADKEEMMLYQGGMSAKTTESIIHGIECDPSKLAGAPQKYVRGGTIPPTEDLKNYDLGKTSLAVLNVPSTYAGQQLGELWVSYTIRLRKPKLMSQNAYNIRRDIWCHSNTTGLPGTNIPTLSLGQILKGSRNSLGGILTVPKNGVYWPTGDNTDILTTVPAAGNTISNNTATNILQEFSLILPPDYSGVLSIRIRGSVSTGGNITWIALTQAIDTIKRFNDMPTIATSGGTKSWQNFRSTSDENYYSQELELHVRVQPASGGVPNLIQFAMNTPKAQTYTYTVPLIEITQYNTWLSIEDNGKADQLDLVTLEGAPGYYA